MLNLDEIATFKAVANSGSFTIAAAQLHVTQSTISHQIKRLEERLDQQLFVRTTRSVNLTLAGERFLPYCTGLLELAKQAEQSMSVEHITGEVKIGVPEEFAHERLPQLVSRFRLHYPKVALYIEIGLGKSLTEKYASDDLDIVVMKKAPTSDDCIKSEPLVWAGSNETLRIDPLPLAFLPNPCSFRSAAIEALESSKRKYSVILVSASLAALRKAAEAGTVITVLPQSQCPPKLFINARAKGLPDLLEMGYQLRANSKADKPVMIAADIIHKLLVE